MKTKLLSLLAAGVLAAGSYTAGSWATAAELAPQGVIAQSVSSESSGLTAACNGTPIVCEADYLYTPTPIVPSETATPLRTPTRQPSVTPTKVTGTPVGTPISTVRCYLEEQGAVRAEPKGMVWYRLTKEGLVYQNVRNAPVGGSIVGRIEPGVVYQVYWRIPTSSGEWLALDQECDRWVAAYLGFISIQE